MKKLFSALVVVMLFTLVWTAIPAQAQEVTVETYQRNKTDTLGGAANQTKTVVGWTPLLGGASQSLLPWGIAATVKSGGSVDLTTVAGNGSYDSLKIRLYAKNGDYVWTVKTDSCTCPCSLQVYDSSLALRTAEFFKVDIINADSAALQGSGVDADDSLTFATRAKVRVIRRK